MQGSHAHRRPPGTHDVDLEAEGGYSLGWTVVPIFRRRERPGRDPLVERFCGTGFRLTPTLLVTCWHCVSEKDEPGAGYAIALPDAGSYRFVPLLNVSRDRNGSDLATAIVYNGDQLPPDFELQLATKAAAGASDVCTYGYPLTEIRNVEGADPQFELHSRYLEGYVTRPFWYAHPREGRRIVSYECDMHAPEGLSGAPLLLRGTPNVIGVVYGVNEAPAIVEWASIDPDTGERRPEVQRIVTFALAHYTSTLRDLRGAATGEQLLADFLVQPV